MLLQVKLQQPVHLRVIFDNEHFDGHSPLRVDFVKGNVNILYTHLVGYFITFFDVCSTGGPPICANLCTS